MTPQLIILKIQSLLGGHSGLSTMDKRALAMEYFRLCSQTQSALEHCVALIKSGRDYAALQFAESGKLLDSINVLTFAELPAWRDFCSINDFPCVPSFDDNLVGLVSSLYSKGITQAHPLYRDYRRAMRLHKFSEALSVIRTITRINSYDAEAREEYTRLRTLVGDIQLAELSRAIAKGDAEKVANLCAELEPESELFADNPIWTEALAYNAKFIEKLNALSCSKICEQLKQIDIEKDWEKAIELISEFNMKKSESTPEGDIEFVDSILEKTAKFQKEKLNAERAGRAKNLLLEELEKGVGSRKQRIKKLTALLSDARDLLDENSIKRVEKKISSLKTASKIAFISAWGTSIAVIAFILLGVWFVYSQNQQRKLMLAAEAELARMEALESVDMLEKGLANFERTFSIGDVATVSRYQALKETYAQIKASLANSDKKLKEFESVKWDSIPNSQFIQNRIALQDFKRAMDMKPRRETMKFDERISKVLNSCNRAMDSRKAEYDRNFRALIDSYGETVKKYASSAVENSTLKKQAASIKQNIEKMISAATGDFKPSEAVLVGYEDLSVLHSQSVKKFEQKKALDSAIASARTPQAYSKALSDMKSSSAFSAAQVGQISKILISIDKFYPEFFAQFGSPKLADFSNDFDLSKGVLEQNPMFFNIYKYLRANKGVVYTSGKVTERTQKWDSGSEILQEANQIGLGGRISKTVYRLNMIKGRQSRGEILSNGILSAESELATQAQKIASEKSLLEAEDFVKNASVNHVFKSLLERAIFRKMADNPFTSGLAYSPSALARMELVEKVTKPLFDYSWIFENPARKNLIKNELYSDVNSLKLSFVEEANLNSKAIKIAKENKPFLVGRVDASGKKILFAKPKGTLWSIKAATDKYTKITNADSLAPYAPIYSETLSIEDIRTKAKIQKR